LRCTVANHAKRARASFRKVSRKYLPLYVGEFSFRYNNRMNDNIFGLAISGC
jgi:hypothetical protein